MRIFYTGYFSLPHSWGFVAQSMMKTFMEMGHECAAINSYSGNPNVIPPYFNSVVRKRMTDIDLCWSYTIPINWNKKFVRPCKYKMAMYAYESSILPKKKANRPWQDDWGKMYKFVDKVLVPSQYVKNIFINSGTPEKHIEIIPHGVNTNDFNESGSKFKLNTNKKFKFLCVATNQWRKNLHQLIKTFVNTFTKQDDVCLIIKTSKTNPIQIKPHECDIGSEFQKYIHKYNCPEIILIYDYMQDLAPLYRACDCYVNVSASEGFGIPNLDAMACGLPVIAPRYGGVLDFLNDGNSILIESKEIKADPRYQFWDYESDAVVGEPNWDQLMESFNFVYNNKQSILLEKESNMKETVKKFSWINAANKMLDLVR